MPVLITDKDTIFVTSGSMTSAVTTSGAVTGRSNLTTQYRMTFVNSAGVITESSTIATNASGHLVVGAPITINQSTDFGTATLTHFTNNYLYVNGGTAGVIVANPTATTIFRIDGAADALIFETNSGEAYRVNSSRQLLIGTATAGASKLRINDDSIEIMTAKTPATAGATGTTGQIAWDANYFYVCVATNTWQRVAHATW